MEYGNPVSLSDFQGHLYSVDMIKIVTFKVIYIHDSPIASLVERNVS